MALVLGVEEDPPTVDARDLVGPVEDRAEAPVPWDEVLLAIDLADLLEGIRDRGPVLELRRVDLGSKALIDIELKPARVLMEEVVLLGVGLHVAVDLGVRAAELEGHV